ncbi:DBH-like monooxygenase protein 1 [Orchesella cincta]|uniref:DBH-like monooxygenase protein 1 n=1 Tax=Orchesella cincta TaxID=48709 RepID=A0A1D2MN16_ORCCI|nr:DBH-like monooxygenase protein 1 [Orchesella cincta]
MLGKTVLISALFLSSCVSGRVIQKNDEFSVKVNQEPLDPQGNYLLSWDVNLAAGKITFEVEAPTLGYVGFGISPSGNMIGADIFIGGVYSNGSTYGFDMHATAMAPPILDTQSDWTLISASEDASKTYLKFSRLLNTCDKDGDYPISNDTVQVIWSMGSSDTIAYHQSNRGTKSLNFLLPDEDNFNPGDYAHLDIVTDVEMPQQDTTYWCSIHKIQALNRKQHVVAFEALLDNELAMNHTHHFIIFKCVAPAGQDADDLFGPFVSHPGSQCYATPQPLPVNYCLQHYLFVWAKGGKRMIFPEDVGYPVPDELGENQYFLMELHYDNPQMLEGRKFKTGARIYHTNQLRPVEAGLLTIAHDLQISFTIPPNQEDFVLTGQCGSQCTNLGINNLPNGLQVFNSLLHGHLSAKKMKLRHFRGDKELPWFDVENHYDFNFQQSKPFPEVKRILKGDHLTVECTYDSRWNEGKVVVGGLSTREEMCMAFLWYYPKQTFEYCSSYYRLADHFATLGITNYTSSKPVNGALREYQIHRPAALAGEYKESLSTKFSWTPAFLNEYQDKHKYDVHTSVCRSTSGNLGAGPVQFPENFVEYVPDDKCNQ